MKIWTFSDTHLDHGGSPLPQTIPECDIIVIAGDLGGTLEHCLNILNIWRNFNAINHIPLIYVPGNHDYYHTAIDEMSVLGAELARELNIILLGQGLPEGFIHNDIRFIGATLWTDYELDNNALYSMQIAERYMNDHKLITTTNTKFTALIASGLHRFDKNLLELQLMDDTYPTVVVTHYLPLDHCVHFEYRNSTVNPAFASHLPELFKGKCKPKLWIHGHTHKPVDLVYEYTRVVCNPRGYPKSVYRPAENPDFNAQLVIEI